MSDVYYDNGYEGVYPHCDTPLCKHAKTNWPMDLPQPGDQHCLRPEGVCPYRNTYKNLPDEFVLEWILESRSQKGR